MKLQDKLRKLSGLIAEIIPNTYHYERAGKVFPCAVWQEDDVTHLWANNGPGEVSVSGTLDYFTRQEFDPAVDDILEGLAAGGAKCTIESIQYEAETGLIHAEYRWRI